MDKANNNQSRHDQMVTKEMIIEWEGTLSDIYDINKPIVISWTATSLKNPPNLKPTERLILVKSTIKQKESDLPADIHIILQNIPKKYKKIYFDVTAYETPQSYTENENKENPAEKIIYQRSKDEFICVTGLAVWSKYTKEMIDKDIIDKIFSDDYCRIAYDSIIMRVYRANCGTSLGGEYAGEGKWTRINNHILSMDLKWGIIIHKTIVQDCYNFIIKNINGMPFHKIEDLNVYLSFKISKRELISNLIAWNRTFDQVEKKPTQTHKVLVKINHKYVLCFFDKRQPTASTDNIYETMVELTKPYKILVKIEHQYVLWDSTCC